MTIRNVIGVMTGTSIDGIDLALCEIKGRGLVQMSCRVVCSLSLDMPKELATSLHGFANENAALTAEELCKLQRKFSLFHVTSIKALLDQVRAEQPAWFRSNSIDLVSIHGQTVYHNPPYYSYQFFSAAPVAYELDLPVVCDLRSADVAAGGQGAPLTPAADWVLFGDVRRTRVVVNLGGFCNVTVLAPQLNANFHHNSDDLEMISTIQDSVKGYDVCACSQLLDAIARSRLSSPYDKDGEAAVRGVSDKVAVEHLAEKLQAQAEAKRSLGTHDSPIEWIGFFSHLSACDLAASAVEAVAYCIANAVPRLTSKHVPNVDVLLAGGGAKNVSLKHALEKKFLDKGTSDSQVLGERVTYTVLLTEELDPSLKVDMREAASWAILGALSQDFQPITHEHATGVKKKPPLAGQWTLPPYSYQKFHF